MGYDANIKRQGLLAVVDLKGRKQAISKWLGSKLPGFPKSSNTLSEAKGLELCWIGTDHWLVIGALEREEELLQTMKLASAPDAVSAVQVSDTLEFFSISGRDAQQIMAIASPLDTTPGRLPENAVTYTEAFGLKALVIRRPDGFDLAIERSYADMIEDYFARVLG